jgi:hypothetical protein
MAHLNRPSSTGSLRTRIVVGTVVICLALTLSAYRIGPPVAAATVSQQANAAAAAIESGKLPPGYRDWTLISVATVGRPVNDIRAKLGNDIAINAFRQGTIPYPDGTIIARLAWKRATSTETNDAIRAEATARGLSPDAVQKLLNETFVAGAPTNVQFMVKDSTRYASTGGWGFAQFTNGTRDSVVMQDCFVCHSPNKVRDFVFTTYSP